MEVVPEVSEKVAFETSELRYRLVGRFLTDKPINFTAMKNTLASVWEPGKGINIKEVGAGRYLFQFYHEVDVNMVLNNGPWTFNQYTLVLKRIMADDQVDRVPLNHVSFWVQIHHLPIGFRTSKIIQNIGDYVGQFMESDDNNCTGTWQHYLRVRVSIDIQKPLKRRMRIKKPGSEWVWVEFRYECLTVFCFICGCLGHTDRKCSKIYDSLDGDIPKHYGPWMKASTRRVTNNAGERWFRFAPVRGQAEKGGTGGNAGTCGGETKTIDIGTKELVRADRGNMTMDMAIWALQNLWERIVGTQSTVYASPEGGADFFFFFLIRTKLKKGKKNKQTPAPSLLHSFTFVLSN